jgi:hypothetical protein
MEGGGAMDGGGKGGKADASKDVETGPQRLKPGLRAHLRHD